MKERPAYAPSSSDDEDPSKEIGVTYKSTRSAVRTGQECGSGVSSQVGLADPALDRENLPLQMWDQPFLLFYLEMHLPVPSLLIDKHLVLGVFC